MMVIEELRIGNYVEYNGCTGVVYAVHSPIPCEDEHFRDIGIVELVIGGIVTARIDEIQPIPLTEELLLKFGLEGYFDSIFTHAKIPCVYFKRPYMESNILLVKSVIGQDKITSVSSIHQLQNFFHSLTGQELEIKK